VGVIYDQLPTHCDARVAFTRITLAGSNSRSDVDCRTAPGFCSSSRWRAVSTQRRSSRSRRSLFARVASDSKPCGQCLGGALMAGLAVSSGRWPAITLVPLYYVYFGEWTLLMGGSLPRNKPSPSTSVTPRGRRGYSDIRSFQISSRTDPGG